MPAAFSAPRRGFATSSLSLSRERRWRPVDAWQQGVHDYVNEVRSEAHEGTQEMERHDEPKRLWRIFLTVVESLRAPEVAVE